MKKSILTSVILLAGILLHAQEELNSLFFTPSGKYPMLNLIPKGLHDNLDSLTVQVNIVSLDNNMDGTPIYTTTVSLSDTDYFQLEGSIVIDSTDSSGTTLFAYRFIYDSYSPVSNTLTLIELNTLYNGEYYDNTANVWSACHPYNRCPSRFFVKAINSFIKESFGYYEIYNEPFIELPVREKGVVKQAMNWMLNNDAATVSDYEEALDEESGFGVGLPDVFCTENSFDNTCGNQRELLDTLKKITADLAALGMENLDGLDSIGNKWAKYFSFNCLNEGNYLASMLTVMHDSGYLAIFIPYHEGAPAVSTIVIFDNDTSYTATAYSYNYSDIFAFGYFNEGQISTHNGFKLINTDSLYRPFPDTVKTITATEPVAVCLGDTISLTVTLSCSPPGGHLLWSTGDTTGSIIVDTLGFYTLTITDEDGCKVDADTVMEFPYRPEPPLLGAQSICSDTTYTFVFDSVVAGVGCNQVEWSLDNSFATSFIIASGDSILVTKSNLGVDTIWLRSMLDSSCVSPPVFTTINKYITFSPPSAPAPKTICSDTVYSFVFDDIVALGCAVQIIDVSTDSLFSAYDSFPNYSGFSISIPPDSTVVIWLRSRNLDLDTVSSSVFTSVTVHQTSNDSSELTISDTIACLNNSISLDISNSHHWLKYRLNIDTSVVDEALGTDSFLLLSTGNLFSPTTFNVTVVDTVTGCVHELHSNFLIDVVYPNQIQPYFTAGSTTICVNEEACYSAFIDSFTTITYAIVQGDANIDSISGCVTNATTDFTIRASVFNKCDTVFGELNVTVVPLAPPIIPTGAYSCSSGLKYFNLDSIKTTSCGSNKIEWSFDSTFAASQTDYSPFNLSISIDTSITRTLWVRSIDTLTNAHSDSISILIPSYLKPYSPIAPEPQTQCSDDTLVQFFFDSITAVGCGGELIEFSLDSTFTTVHSQNSPADTSLWVETNHTVALWIRSKDTITGLYSDPVRTFARLMSEPSTVSNVASQSVCSDTGFVFSLTPKAGNGGNEIVWSSNALFSDSQIVASNSEITISLPSPSDSTIWFKTRDSVSGKVSRSSSFDLKVSRFPQGSIFPTDTTVEEGDTIALVVTTDSICTLQWIGLSSTDSIIYISPYYDSVYYTVSYKSSSGCESGASSVINRHKSTGNDEWYYKVIYDDINQDEDLPHPMLTGAVGRTPGVLDVSNSGAAVYTIPIQVPPGINNMTPDLSIVYKSQAGNGLCGWGWNIAGLHAISRVGNNMYMDEKVSPITYTSADGFVLDGQRLIPTGSTGDNGLGSGTVYATESESFARIIAHDNGNVANPLWWDIWTKDGVHMTLGHFNNSTVTNPSGTLIWKIDNVSDSYNNSYSILYKDMLSPYSNYQNVLDKITYAGGNTIQFDYLARTDVDITYVAGEPILEPLLLDKITVTGHQNTPFKKYQFKYAFVCSHSILNEVIETGSDGVSQLNSTLFKNGDIPLDMNGNPFYPLSTESSAISHNWGGTIMTGDYDGDGLSDFVTTREFVSNGNYNQSLKVFRRKPDNTGFEFKCGQQYTNGAIYNGTIGRFSPTFTRISQSDVDGDGKDDIMKVVFESVQSAHHFQGIYFYDVSGNSFVLKPQYIGIPAPYWGFNFWDMGANGKGVYTGDFDGDGRMDVITVLNLNGNAALTMFVSFLGLNSNNNAVVLSNGIPIGSFFDGNDQIHAVDFNGDGKTDLVRLSPLGAHCYTLIKNGNSYVLTEICPIANYPTGGSQVYWGDFNGDSKADVLTRTYSNAQNNSWEVAYSTGMGFTQKIPFPFSSKPTSLLNIVEPPVFWNKLLIGDYNGDGKSDVLFIHRIPGQNWDNFDTYYSTGLSFRQYTTVYNGDTRYVPITNADFNGDGRTDILNVGIVASAPNSAFNTHNFDVISLHKFGTEKLLEKICDGFNVVKEISYGLLSSGQPFHTKILQNSYPLNDIQPRTFCVKETKTPNGFGVEKTIIDYKYKGASCHRTGRGFLGFTEMQAHNQTTGGTEITRFSIDQAFYVPLMISKKMVLNGLSAIPGREFTNYIVSLNNTPGNKRFWNRLDRIKETDMYDFNNETNFQYDNYGNVTHSETNTANTGNSIVDNKVINTWVYQQFNAPVPNKPISCNTQTIRKGCSPFNKIVTYDYWSTGALKIQTDFPNTSCEVSTSFYYNNYGNLTVKSLSGFNLTTRTENYTEYDAYQLFPTKKTNPLGQWEEFSYDHLWGKISSYKGVDGNTTTYQYDAFGRLINVHSPHGYDVSTTYNWDVDDNGSQRYYTLTESSITGRPERKDWFDFYDRTIHTKVKGWNNNWLTSDTSYNNKGLINAINKPYYQSETPEFANYTYDNFSRLTNVLTQVSSSTYSYIKIGDKLKTSLSVTDASNSNARSSYTETDAAGKVVAANDAGGILDFTYDSYGNQTSVKKGALTLVANEFDICGNQTKLIDKDAGPTEYIYDAFKQLKRQVDANGKGYDMDYDLLGRLTQKVPRQVGGEGTLRYEYVPSGSYGVNLLKKVTKLGWSSNSNNFLLPYNDAVKEYEYDQYSRVTSYTEIPDGNTTLTTTYSYNDFDDITSVNYNSGFGYNKNYDANGYLTSIKDQGNSHTIYQVLGMNGLGQCTSYSLGNAKTTTITYGHGNPTRLYTPTVQDLYYDYQYPSSNVLFRYDDDVRQYESFTYDNLDRLTSSVFPFNQPSLTSAYNYDANGNITSKPDVGNVTYYSNDRIHAVKRLTNPNNVVPATQQDITYTSFNQPDLITEGSYQAAFGYSSDYQRNKMAVRYNQNASPFITRYYSGLYEKQDIFLWGAHKIEDIHYIKGLSGLAAIVVRENNNNSYYYTYNDHLGTITKVTDASGAVILSKNYDAWGRPRNPSNWTQHITWVPDMAHTWLYRGFTGHEELPWFSLINMNGRLYDPVVGRVLSPDNVVQSPHNTQSYNRYSYCMNNPLKYVDPSGEIWYYNMLTGEIDWFEDNFAASKAWGTLNYNNIGTNYFDQATMTWYGSSKEEKYTLITAYNSANIDNVRAQQQSLGSSSNAPGSSLFAYLPSMYWSGLPKKGDSDLDDNSPSNPILRLQGYWKDFDSLREALGIVPGMDDNSPGPRTRYGSEPESPSLDIIDPRSDDYNTLRVFDGKGNMYFIYRDTPGGSQYDILIDSQYKTLK